MCVHACKIRGSDSQCFNLGSTSTKDCCQGLRGLRRETASYPGPMSLEKVPTRRTRSMGSTTLLESSHGLEAWRRLHSELRPHVVHATRGDPSAGSEPTALSASRGSGICAGGLALKVTSIRADRNGRPSQASDDSLVAAMFRLMPKNLEETVMFTNEDEGFQELFDRLLTYSSTRQSVKMSESKRQTRRCAEQRKVEREKQERQCWLR